MTYEKHAKTGVDRWKEVLCTGAFKRVLNSGVSTEDEDVVLQYLVEAFNLDSIDIQTLRDNMAGNIGIDAEGRYEYNIAGINRRSEDITRCMRIISEITEHTDKKDLLYALHIMVSISNWEQIKQVIMERGAEMEIILGDNVITKLLKGLASLHTDGYSEDAMKLISEALMSYHSGKKREYLPFVKRAIIDAAIFNFISHKDVNSLLAIYSSIDKDCPVLKLLHDIMD